MKSRFFLFVFILMLALLTGCGRLKTDTAETGNGKPKIVCTLFPQYDFARTLYDGQAEVTMLLEPGQESHMYDPTPQAMVEISNADLFVYTGDEMEPWAGQIVESLSSDVSVLDLSKHVTLEMEDEDEHEHGHEVFEHHHSYDPHFWLDLSNAEKMVQAIAAAADSLNVQDAQAVRDRADAYCDELHTLDQAFYSAVEKADHKDIVFAGRFAYGYFVHRYGLDYETVYHSCSAESDPSVYDMARIIDYIRKNKTQIVFYEELSSGSVAGTLAQDTGVQTMQFSTAHNVSKEEFESGITFIDIMEQNLEALKKALGE